MIDTPRVRKQTRHFSTLRDDDLVEFSDLDSEDEEKPRARRHDRQQQHQQQQQQQQQQQHQQQQQQQQQHALHAYGRTDCFRVEKHLLVYG